MDIVFEGDKTILKNKIFILDEVNNGVVIDKENVAIVMALYYEDEMEQYISYLSVIPPQIHVFIVSSSKSVLEAGTNLQSKHKNLYVIEKENRGRDLSALLVAFRPYIEKYDYLCFLHDKKSKHKSLNEDLSFWVENLWGNMICSEDYISQAIELLRTNKYGILLPPKPIGEYMDSMYTDPWDNDFENVVELAHALQLNMSIDREDKEHVSLGSVFWCKTAVLEKLFAHNWKYTDFPEEPMPNDGTISHAIERIFGFVAMDAGYDVGVIVNTTYASKVLTILQNKLKYTYEWLWKNMGIKNTYQLSEYQKEKECVARLFAKGQVYLYGAGDYGIQYLQKLKTWGYMPSGFVVSDGEKSGEKIQGLSVKKLSEVERENNAVFIITTNPATQEEIALNLERKGFMDYYKAACI